jgi:glycosyltransferase involved in cell wall biosynthesis
MTLPGKQLSVVVIGRNEGERLTQCLESVLAATGDWAPEVIYVDSDSTDDSVRRALASGAAVVRLHEGRMTAARGRNAGWRTASTDLILFVDGDCVLQRGFLERAMSQFQDPSVGVVWGVLEEEHQDHSLYQRAIALDWIYPQGDSEFCGGNALMRRSALEAVGGFDESLAAGEEPDLCTRMRAAGHRIVHIDTPMVLHDSRIASWRQYWRRAVRSGEAYAAVRRKLATQGFWGDIASRNYWRGSLYVALAVSACVASLFYRSFLPVAVILIGWLLLAWRTSWRARWKSADPWTRFLYGLHSHFVYLPLLIGQARYDLRVWRQVHQ